MLTTTSVFVSVFSSRGDKSLEYLLRGILQQSYEGDLGIKVFTSQSAFTTKLINRLPQGLARANYSIELVTIRSFRDYELYSTQLFKASMTDLFIPCLPNSYWIHADKVQHHVSSLLAGYEVSWHPTVMRDHRVSSASSWAVIDAPTKYSPAFSQTFFTRNASRCRRPTTLSLDDWSGTKVDKLRLPMVQANKFGWRPKAMHWLKTFWQKN